MLSLIRKRFTVLSRLFGFLCVPLTGGALAAGVVQRGGAGNSFCLDEGRVPPFVVLGNYAICLAYCLLLAQLLGYYLL